MLGAAVAGRRRAQAAILALAGLAFLATAAIALFHVGVEQGWWRGTAACGGTLETGLSLEEFKSQVLDAPLVRCDEVPWALFGVSIAGYNFLYATACGIAAMLAAGRSLLRPR